MQACKAPARHRCRTISRSAYEYLHLDVACARPPTTVAFKVALHQAMQQLFGLVYAALPIDVIRWVAARGAAAINVVLRVLSSDTAMVVQTLPGITSFDGQQAVVSLCSQPTAHLFLIPPCDAS